jgi:hypothetical protein
MSEEGELLPFANVIIKENNNGAATDRKGKFKLTSIPGEYTLKYLLSDLKNQLIK